MRVHLASIMLVSAAMGVLAQIDGHEVDLFAQEASSGQSRLPLLENDEAWRMLPQEQPSLPAWARVLIRPLPRTTAAMLELDYLHRAANPLGPVLAGELRWAVADVLQCDYSRRYAEADLKRAGWNDDDLQRLAGDATRLPDSDRAAVEFARQLTRAAHEVTDGQFAHLLELFGAEKVVAIVHTIACANFQNRLVLALGVRMEPDGPLPPLELRLDPQKRLHVPAPARPAAHELDPSRSPAAAVAPDWTALSFADLQAAMERQKSRRLRIPLPDPGRLQCLPPDAREDAQKILWNTISSGYQPLMTRAWFDCRRLYKEEAKLDRMFGNAVFWVVTRTNDCFY